MSGNQSALKSKRLRRIATYSNQLVTDATVVPVFLQPTDWTVDDLAATFQLCFVVPEVDKELEFD